MHLKAVRTGRSSHGCKSGGSFSDEAEPGFESAIRREKTQTHLIDEEGLLGVEMEGEVDDLNLVLEALSLEVEHQDELPLGL